MDNKLLRINTQQCDTMIFDSFLSATEVHILNMDLFLARQELFPPEFIYTISLLLFKNIDICVMVLAGEYQTVGHIRFLCDFHFALQIPQWVIGNGCLQRVKELIAISTQGFQNNWSTSAILVLGSGKLAKFGWSAEKIEILFWTTLKNM